MQHRFPVFQRKANQRIQTLFNRINRRIQLNHPLRFLLGDGFHQIRQVLKIVVKGVAVDSTVVINILNGDLAQRLLIEQLDKRSANRLLGKICHSLPLPPCPVTEHFLVFLIIAYLSCDFNRFSIRVFSHFLHSVKKYTDDWQVFIKLEFISLCSIQKSRLQKRCHFPEHLDRTIHLLSQSAENPMTLIRIQMVYSGWLCLR